MAKCGYCGSSIFIGGLSSNGERFCNKRCLTNAFALSAARQIPPEEFERRVDEIFRSNCPKCGGSGPVDVHKVHQVWSAVVLTRWSSRLQLSCRSCATKSQSGAALFSAALGWWGFPWGLILTPVQITRNIAGICAGPKHSIPSAALRKLVLVNIGTQALNNNRRNSPPPLPK